MDAEAVAFTVVGVISAGTGVTMVLGGDRTRATLGIGSLYVLAGISFPLQVHLVGTVDPHHPGLLARLQGVVEAGAVASGALYVSGLLTTARTTAAIRRRISRALRAAWVLAGWLAVAAVLFPAARLDDYQTRLADPDAYRLGGFWLFACTWLLVAVVFGFAYFNLAACGVDPGERARAGAALVGTPLLVSVTAFPLRPGLGFGIAAILLMLYAQYRYAVAQGERAAFLSRFLSPQVADEVRAGGLASVMQPRDLEVTVVCCDLRGFTAYAEAVPSQSVIDLLSEYYEVVGEVVAEVDGTIKDYAGDGILVLVGAPLPDPDHARAGLRLARRIHEVTTSVLRRRATADHPLGIGVGVATGVVTVGAIGSDARMEYTAVGVAVNLAARLCSAAAAGETLVDQRTSDLGPETALEARAPMHLKGFGADVAVFATSAPTRWVG
jgi:class 3 adenylate cyclase